MFFLGVFISLPVAFSKEGTYLSWPDIRASENLLAIHGKLYDIKDWIDENIEHSGGVEGITRFLGYDASKLFPRDPPITLPEKCLDMQKVEAFGLNVKGPGNNFTNPTCPYFNDIDIALGINTCHTFATGYAGVKQYLGDFERGTVSYSTYQLNKFDFNWIIIYDRVYDVTKYVNAIRENFDLDSAINQAKGGSYSSADNKNNAAAWLTPTLNMVIMNGLRSNATDLYVALFGSNEYLDCLEDQFFIGILDDSSLDQETPSAATPKLFVDVGTTAINGLCILLSFITLVVVLVHRMRTYGTPNQIADWAVPTCK